MTEHDFRRVAPFRNPRIYGCLAPPRGLSQLTTSFFAFRRQGIHPMLLSTCFSKNNPSQPYSIVKEHSQKKGPCSAWFAGTIPCAYSHEGMRQNAAAPWWAWKDLNFRPHAYQACALAT